MKKSIGLGLATLAVISMASCGKNSNENGKEETGNGFTTQINTEETNSGIATQNTNLQAITLDTTNLKTSYIVGEQADFSSLVVNARYIDGTSKPVTNYKIDESTYDLSKKGDYFVKVIYEEEGIVKTRNFRISVTSILDDVNYVVGVSATGAKETYAYQESLDISNLNVVATYKDGSTKQLSSNDYQIDSSKFDSQRRGSYEIIVKYDETYTSGSSSATKSVETCFFATVKLNLESISFASGTKEFLQYNGVSTSDWKIKVNFAEGVSEIISSGFETDIDKMFENSTTAQGNKRVTISYTYNGVTKTASAYCKVTGTSDSLNAGSLDVVSHSENNTVVSSFEVLKGYSVLMNTETCGEQSFARSITFDGDGSRNENSLKITLNSKGIIQLVANTDESSNLVLYDEAGNAIKQYDLSTTPTRYTFDNLSAGTYYLWSTTQVNIYFVSIFNR